MIIVNLKKIWNRLALISKDFMQIKKEKNNLVEIIKMTNG